MRNRKSNPNPQKEQFINSYKPWTMEERLKLKDFIETHASFNADKPDKLEEEIILQAMKIHNRSKRSIESQWYVIRNGYVNVVPLSPSSDGGHVLETPIAQLLELAKSQFTAASVKASDYDSAVQRIDELELLVKQLTQQLQQAKSDSAEWESMAGELEKKCNELSAESKQLHEDMTAFSSAIMLAKKYIKE